MKLKAKLLYIILWISRGFPPTSRSSLAGEQIYRPSEVRGRGGLGLEQEIQQTPPSSPYFAQAHSPPFLPELLIELLIKDNSVTERGSVNSITVLVDSTMLM